MKTLQIKLTVAIIFIFTSFAVNAQTKTTKTTAQKQRTEEKQRIKLLNEIPVKQPSSTITTSPGKITPRDGNKRVSDYFNMEKAIMERSVNGEIPASFPKHIEGQTKEQYLIIMKNWGKSNLDLIKKEYHSELLTRN